MKKIVAALVGTLALGVLAACSSNPNGRAEISLGGAEESVNVLCASKDGRVVVSALGSNKIQMSLKNDGQAVEALVINSGEQTFTSLQPGSLDVTAADGDYTVTGKLFTPEQITQRDAGADLVLKVSCGKF